MKKRFSIVLVVAMIQLVCVSSSFAAPIHDAAKDGNLAEVTRLIAENRANANAPDEYGYTPLHWAALKGHTTTVQTLIASGANAKAVTEDGRTPLHFAAFHGDTVTVQALIASGADVNARNGSGKTPLNWAAVNSHADTVAVLQPEAIAQVHTQTAEAHTFAGKHTLAARSHTWAANALPGTEAARVSHTRAAESHLESKNDVAATESYTLAGSLPADIHTLVAEYLSTNPHGLDSEAVADRHVRAMLSHMSAADIHHAGGNNAGVELALAAAKLSREKATVAYEQHAVNLDAKLERTHRTVGTAQRMTDSALISGNRPGVVKSRWNKALYLVRSQLQTEKIKKVSAKLDSVAAQHLDRLARLER